MQVKTVEVQIHEKRNNPHAYGHYDASVRLTAELSGGELRGTEGAIEELLGKARGYVLAECDRWEASVRASHKAAQEEDGRLLRKALLWDTGRDVDEEEVDHIPNDPYTEGEEMTEEESRDHEETMGGHLVEGEQVWVVDD